jgi:MYXO-CTERM domain-containing protein
VLEENYALHARVNVGGVQQDVISPPLAADQWSHVAFEYDGPTGKAGFWVDDVQVTDRVVATGTLTATTDDLVVGAAGPRAACPDGDGAFAGRLDELSISRFSRHWGMAPPPVGTGGGEPTGTGSGSGAGGPGASGAGGGSGGAGGGDGAAGGDAGCSCRTTSGSDGAALGLAAVMLGLGLARRRTRR